MTDAIAWPKKTRELHNHRFHSTISNDLQFRDDDIIIATYAESDSAGDDASTDIERGRVMRRARPTASDL
jgi:hypothetical protein